MASKTYTQEEVDQLLKDQVAQLTAGLLQHNDNPMVAGPLDTPRQQYAGPIAAQFGQQYGNNSPGAVQIPPQGFGTLPGAGTFGPQGVLFAGGSPWPVSARPAQMANMFYGINQALNFLRQSGLLDKLIGTQK